MEFMLTIWKILAYLVFALIDFVIIEIIAYWIHKRSYFKKTEWFVFLIIGMALSAFVISNLIQNWVVSILITLNNWLWLMFFGFLSLAVFFLTKFVKERKNTFRLVVISILGMIIVAIITIIKLILRFK